VDWDAALIEAIDTRSPRRARRRMLAALPDRDDASLPPEHPWLTVRGRTPSWAPPTCSDEALPPEPERVLAVARLWTAVRWTYPYLDEVEDTWRAALPTAVEQARAATTPSAYQDALLGLAVHMRDGHVGVEGPAPSRTTVGRDFAIWSDGNGSGPLVLRVADAVNAIQAGDRLVAVEGTPWEDLAAPFESLAVGSTALGRLRTRDQQVLESLAGRRNAQLRRPDGSEYDTPVQFGRPTVFPRPAELDGPFRRLSDDVVVADLQLLRYDDLAGLMEAARDARGLVLDLRAYPEYMPQSLVSCLTREARPFARMAVVDPSTPGRFSESVASAGGGVCPGPMYDGPVVVVIDGLTFSRGEWVAQALASIPRVRFVGEPTAGTDGNRVGLPLPGRVTVYTSWLGVAWPDGSPVQRIGVQPDVSASYTAEGLAAGRDEKLEAALATLRSEASVPD
jgi:hypothetical protein